MFSSTVIATVGRPTLSRAVDSVLDQALPGEAFEIIVVNDSGTPLLPSDWHRSPQVRILDTQRRERSIARNTGAAVARGRYLHFLDDDDWLAPDALRRLGDAVHASDAAWIYGHSLLVDRSGLPLIPLRHTLSGNCFAQAMAGEWIPLQASLVRADAFFAAGGFNPLIAGPEDIDLLRRVSLHGSLACVPAQVAYISWGAEASTTDYVRHPAQSREARELFFEQRGALARMRASAGSSYWQGRVVRAYATSVVWNLRRRRLPTAAVRAGYAVGSALLAGGHLLSPAFWRAVTRPHASEVFAAGARDAHGHR